MMGRIAALALLLAGVLGGAAMYYFQVYGYYVRLPAQSELRVQTVAGPEMLAVQDFDGIDSDSSPLRFRACLRLAGNEASLIPYTAPQPLNAPRWFACFDARALEADLAAGRAQAWLVEDNFRFGFDRVMALYPDGQAFLWHQMNACGTAHFDGRTLPQGCPPASES